MNIIRNDKLIKRNSRLALFILIASILVMGAGAFTFLRFPDKISIAYGALILGYILTQVSTSMTNRWGRKPRPDEILDQALKGLDRSHTLYHYSSPVSHLLVSPSGLWIFLPYFQGGVITYSKGRWRQKGGNPLMKFFGQEGLRRPDLDLEGDLISLRRFLEKKMPGEPSPTIRAALVFTSPKVELAIPPEANPPAPAVTPKELKELVRKSSKSKALSPTQLQTIQNMLS